MSQRKIQTTLLTPKQIEDIKNGDSLTFFRAQSIDEYHHNHSIPQSSGNQKTFREKKITLKKNGSYSNNMGASSASIIKPNNIGVAKRKAYNPVKVITLENTNDIKAKEFTPIEISTENRLHLNEGSPSSIKPINTRFSKRKASNPVKLVEVENKNATRKKAIAPEVIYDSTGRKMYLSSYTKEEISAAHSLILLRNRPVNTLEEKFKRKNKRIKMKQLYGDPECSQSSSSSISLESNGERWSCQNVNWDDNSETLEYPITISSSSSSSEIRSNEDPQIWWNEDPI